ncbi:MAG: chloride channel protein [Ruminococcus sp.]|nr:chloride channel protein [Ruminococcus sp.]
MKLKEIFVNRENVLYQYFIFVKWLILSVFLGAVIGAAGAVFHIALDCVTEFRTERPYMIFLLPLGGLLIVLLYRLCGMDHDKGTNGIIMGARSEDTVSVKTAPLIVAATLITHLLGGSAGREGAALQLGGSMAAPLSKPLRLGNKRDYSMLIMCGMSAGFGALFGTPAAAAVFAIEVTVVGITHYSAIVPCLLSALTAAMVSDRFGVRPTAFMVRYIPDFDSHSYFMVIRTVFMGIAGALVSIIFCKAMSGIGSAYKKYIKNPYLRIFAGGAAVAVLSYIIFLITGKFDYNGAGTDVIARAFIGQSRPEAFILKILMTALTLGAGFKGGEIVPSLFIGSTFGCFFGSLMGFSHSFGAALGLAAVFCGVTNCPFASLVLAVELFGSEGLPYYALVIGISYMLSDYTGLYSAQKFYDNKFIHRRFTRQRTYREIKLISKHKTKKQERE